MAADDGWRGGKALGSITEREAAWRVQIGERRDERKVFNFLQHGGKEAAWVAADLWRRERSLALNLTKNRWRIDGQVLSVLLTQGAVMRTDAAALPLVEAHYWHANCLKGNLYGYTSIDRKMVAFHTVYTGFVMVDHISGVTLDNRRENLREADYGINARNRGARKKKVAGSGKRFNLAKQTLSRRLALIQKPSRAYRRSRRRAGW